eukprot:m.155989 g.155989  ORF g.155989 m.155989 type:complete len:88 (+) comp24673_c0_seq4:718-981(+)
MQVRCSCKVLEKVACAGAYVEGASWRQNNIDGTTYTPTHTSLTRTYTPILMASNKMEHLPLGRNDGGWCKDTEIVVFIGLYMPRGLM